MDSIGILQIVYEGTRYEVFGNNLDLEGNEQGTFRCYASLYDNFVLRYAYDGANVRQLGSRVDGYGEYHFSRNPRGPVSFAGFLSDSYYNSPLILKGRRITNKESILRITEKETRHKIIQLFLEEKQF